MLCSQCGNKTKVIDSRCGDSNAKFGGQKQIRDSVSWYTQDWVARRRRCSRCASVTLTVEILVSDLESGAGVAVTFLGFAPFLVTALVFLTFGAVFFFGGIGPPDTLVKSITGYCDQWFDTGGSVPIEFLCLTHDLQEMTSALGCVVWTTRSGRCVPVL